jgi:hypothetical protein
MPIIPPIMPLIIPFPPFDSQQHKAAEGALVTKNNVGKSVPTDDVMVGKVVELNALAENEGFILGRDEDIMVVGMVVG